MFPNARLIATDDPRVAKFIQGFINWWHEAKPEVIFNEQFISCTYYAGTCDLGCHIDGEPWLIDVKTSAGVYTSHHLQTAAYASCLSETRWRRGVLLLKTSTKKGWQMVESDRSYKEDLDAFMGCRAVYHREHGFKPIPYEEKEAAPTTFRLEQHNESI